MSQAEDQVREVSHTKAEFISLEGTSKNQMSTIMTYMNITLKINSGPESVTQTLLLVKESTILVLNINIICMFLEVSMATHALMTSGDLTLRTSNGRK